MVYEGEMRDDSYKYEFELDAATGEVLKWEREARRTQTGGNVSQTGNQTGNGGNQAGNTGNQTGNSGGQTSGNTADAMSYDAASSIVLGKAQADGAWMEELELDREDGRLVYEGEMKDSAYEYDFELDAVTGEVLKWEVEGLGR